MQRFFSTPDDDMFVQNLITYKKVLSEKFHRNALVSTHRPITEFQRVFSAPGGNTMVLNSISYKKVPSKNFHRFQLIDQQVNSEGFFRPLVKARLIEIQFST